jgi:serine/threonine protein kinase
MECNTIVLTDLFSTFHYSKGVDWWSFGALAYEMMIGNPPFQSKNDKDLDNKILHARVQLPRWLSSEAHSFLKGLLERNIQKRLGSAALGADSVCGAKYSATRGIHTIKNHPFFKKIDWKALERLQIHVPIVPVIQNETDISHFDDKLTKLTPCDIECEIPLTQDELFIGFSFYGEDELLEQSAVPSKPIASVVDTSPPSAFAPAPAPAPAPVSIHSVAAATSRTKEKAKIMTSVPCAITIEPGAKPSRVTHVLKVRTNQVSTKSTSSQKHHTNMPQQTNPHKSYQEAQDYHLVEEKEKKHHHSLPESVSSRAASHLFQITKSIAAVFK